MLPGCRIIVFPVKFARIRSGRSDSRLKSYIHTNFELEYLNIQSEF